MVRAEQMDPKGVAHRLQEIQETQEGVTVSPLHQPSPQDVHPQWFVANRPWLGEINSLVAPNLEVSLPQAWQELVHRGNQDLYQEGRHR